jgi:hypothetical protein
MSKLIKATIFGFFTCALLVACAMNPVATAVPAANPYAPQRSDDNMMRGDPEIVSASVISAESSPSQVSILLGYRLPTPCYELRVNISQPDNQNRIQLVIYGVAPKDKPCTLMALLTPMEANIGLGSFPAGHYTTWVNGTQIGEFDAQ